MRFPSPQQTQTAVNRSAQSSCQTLRWAPRFWDEGRRGDQSRHAAHLELFKSISVTTGELLSRLDTVECNHNTALSKLLSLLLKQGTASDHRALEIDARLQRAVDKLAVWKLAKSDWLLICKVFPDGF